MTIHITISETSHEMEKKPMPMILSVVSLQSLQVSHELYPNPTSMTRQEIGLQRLSEYTQSHQHQQAIPPTLLTSIVQSVNDLDERIHHIPTITMVT